jgi:hypothetical protein
LISRGMGEGWSDFYARALLSSADEDVHGIFNTGAWLTFLHNGFLTDNYYYGIRRFAYVVKSTVGPNGKPHNPFTLGTIDFAKINALNNGAFPSSPATQITANNVHNIGTVWCTTLLEMRARLIRRYGYAIGHERALQIVTDGMKMDPTNPTLLQGRDSLIAAANAGFGGEDVPDIRAAFATRGMGAGATISGTTFFTVAESFYPSSTPGAVTVNDSLGNNNGVAEPGEDVTITIPLTNRLPITDTNVQAKLGDFTTSYGDIAPGATVVRTFSYRVPLDTACGANLQLPFTVTSSHGIADVRTVAPWPPRTK